MRKCIKTVIISLLILFCSIVAGFALLSGAYSLPTWWIKYHVHESSETFYYEREYPDLYSNHLSQLDNYTDALMLIQSEFHSNTPLNDAIFAKREEAKGAETPVESIISFYNDPSHETIEVTYPQYWHGYLVLLKPMLIFFNYSQIRTINFFCQTLLAFICLFLLFKKGFKLYIPAFLFLFAFQDIYLTSHSLQFSSMYYIYIVSVILLLLFFSKLYSLNMLPYFFLFVGITTAFFDFLTYPLVSYGIPVTVCLIHDTENTWQVKLKKVIVFGVFWILGYGGMWVGKSLVGSLIVQENLFKNFMAAVEFRSGAGNYGKDFTRISSLTQQFLRLKATFIFPFFCCYIGFLLGKLCDLKGVFRSASILPFALVCLSPICWYLVLANHSWIHSFFTYKTLYILIFCLICMLTKLNVGGKKHISPELSSP